VHCNLIPYYVVHSATDIDFGSFLVFKYGMHLLSFVSIVFFIVYPARAALMADNLRNSRGLFVAVDLTFMRSVMAKVLLIDNALLVKIEVLDHFLAF